MEDSIIPNSFEEWKRCITIDCGIQLTTDYIEQRINELNDQNEYRTEQFIRLYGSQHHQRVLEWFHEAKNTI